VAGNAHGSRASALAAGEILDLADAVQGTDVVAHGRMLLAAARPEWSGPMLDQVAIGDRDACVLALRCATFGDRVEGRTFCPQCGTQLAIETDADVLTGAPAPSEGAVSAPFEFASGSYTATVQSPDGAALARAAATGDRELARLELVGGCVRSTHDGEEVVAVADLPTDVVAAIGDAIVDHDPQAEVRLALTCAACGHQWMCLFDSVAFLIAELENLAAHLVEDVHTLAVAYGWSEDQVLALSSRRRRRYVERAVGE
jgi:hypothetical protein